MSELKYVLITAARNEEDFIEKTIKSVINQTILPKTWIIVSDGSTDRTDEIVESYSSKFDFIKLMWSTGEKVRSFGSKAKAVMYAYNNLMNHDFEFIGNLDADISFDSTYYENIFNEFERDEKLGVAGGVRFDFCDGSFRRLPCASNSVGGPFQLFRRNCFDQVGGYSPLKYGGIDAAAEMTARMLGWKVQSFTEYKLYHHRCTGSWGGDTIKYRIRTGFKFYSLGYITLFITLKFLKETFRRPVIIGSLLSICAYFWATIFRFEKQISEDVIIFLRKEQKERLKSFLRFRKDARKNFT